MKHFFLLIILMFGLASCCSKRTSSPVVVPIQTLTTTRTVHTVAFKTTPVTLPLQSFQHTTRDSASHLETDAAVSDARINPDGSLFHSLENKGTPISVPVESTADSIFIEKVIEVPVKVEVPVEVERQLTKWEKACTKFAPWSIGLNVLAAGFFFRRPIINLARSLLNSKK